MHHEAEVRLVEAHPQRGRGHERLDLVVLEELLGPFPVRGIGAAGVGQHLVAGLGQQPGGVLGRGHGQRVDDPAARQVRQVRQQPAEPLAGIRQRQHAEPQRLPAQGAADGQHAVAQLLLDVVDHPGVGRGGGGQHRNGVRQLRDEVRDAPVVGPEVVAPVGNAVGLVDDQQPGAADELRQLVFAERGVGEPFGRNQQDVHLVRGELLAHRVPLQLVGGVDGDGPDAGPGGGGHLVPHQRQQRRNDQRGARPAPPEQQRGHEVDRRLPPAGPLHHQGPPAAVDQGLDGLELAVVEVGFRVPHQLPQHLQGLAPGPRDRRLFRAGCRTGRGWRRTEELQRAGYWPLIQYPSRL